MRLRTFVSLLVLAAAVVALALLRREGGPERDARGREVWREAENARCLEALGEAGAADLAPRAAIAGEGACGIDRPLALRAVTTPLASATGANRRVTVSLGTAHALSCPAAEALRQWLMESVQPAAAAHFRQPVRALRTLGSYSCRTIAGSRTLSEHAFANAIDIAGFVLADGRDVVLARDWDGGVAQRAFLRDVSAGACRAFRTVLGPDHDAAHRDHFHLDMARRPFGAVCR